MPGLKRYLDILRLFGDRHKALTVPQIAVATKSPASSVYRNVRELLREGFMEGTVDAHYRLGPAFIDFTRRMQITDPLLSVGARLLPSLAEQARIPCYAVLCRLYGDQVMCIADAKGADADFRTSYERGRPMPLTRGATSKAILARLAARKLEQLLAADIKSARERKKLLDYLAGVRKSGYCITSGEVDKNLTGMAASIHNKELGINASLSLVVQQKDLSDDRQAQLLPILLSTATVIGDLMKNLR